jgi:phosphomannomutase/phosphoglucomutase
MTVLFNRRIFREYDIRGIADTDLDGTVAPALGRAIGTWLRHEGRRSAAVGRDCRTSSPRLHEAIVQGLRDSGLDVVDVGVVPTPLLYFAVHHLKADGGVMITGSHNPAEQNGFKICSGPSTIHGEQIQEIADVLASGAFATGCGSYREQDVLDAYVDWVARDIPEPLRIPVAIDCGNGVAGVVARRLYERLGAEVTEIYGELDGTFPNHHPDPTVAENLADLASAVTQAKARLGIGFDGDADRIGVVDPSGRVLFGDELMVIYSRAILAKHPGAAVISEVKASHRLFQDVTRHGGRAIQWKTGHSLIKAKLKEEKALLAGEMSGHIFFADRYFGYDDALYAGARLLEIVARTGKTPAELIADLPPSVATPEIRVDCADDRKFDVVRRAVALLQAQGLAVNTIDGARVEFPDGWGLVRASNTQPVLVFRFEATSETRLAEIRAIVEGAVQEAEKPRGA